MNLRLGETVKIIRSRSKAVYIISQTCADVLEDKYIYISFTMPTELPILFSVINCFDVRQVNFVPVIYVNIQVLIWFLKN